MDAPDERPRRPNPGFGYLLFLAFMFFLMNGGQNDPTYQRTLAAAIDRRTLQRARLSDWIYGNYTADVKLPFVIGQDEANDLARIQEANQTFSMPNMREPLVDRLVEPLMNSHAGRLVYHRNVTGFLKGEWKPLNVSLPPQAEPPVEANQTDTAPLLTWDSQRGAMPWLDDKKVPRKIALNVRESREAQSDPDIAILRGNLEFEAQGTTARLDVEGIHLLGSGRIYLMGYPEDSLIDIRILPALLNEPEEVNRTSLAILHELDVRVRRMTDVLRSGTVATGDADFTSDTASNCTFAIYGKLLPERRLSSQELAEWEANIEQPGGSSIIEPDPASMDAIAYSGNCGLILEIKDAKSLLMDSFWSKALNYSAAFAIVALIQVFLLVSQMESTNTAATIQRVSYWTVSMQVGMDAYAFVTHLTLGVVTNNRASLPLLIPSFFLCLGSLLFGLRYAASIRVATASNRSTPIQAPAPPASPVPEASSDALMPVSTVPAERSAILASDSPIWVAIPLAILLTVVILLILVGWLVLTLVGLYSYWIPQIYANAERDASRRTFKKTYIIGTTSCRLFLPLYIWACPDNVLFAEPSRWVWALVAYQVLQVSILLLQDYLGPRFFLPKGVFPDRQRWDYHPILPPPDVEAPGGMSYDCIICLETIELPNKEENESMPTVGALSRWSYMVPPCHHVAHTRCLGSWLAVKSECPVCRRPLPQM